MDECKPLVDGGRHLAVADGHPGPHLSELAAGPPLPAAGAGGGVRVRAPSQFCRVPQMAVNAA